MQIGKRLFLLLQVLLFNSCSDPKGPLQLLRGVSKMQVDDQGLSRMEAVLQTVHGPLEIRFYLQKAPKTVARITELIRSKFYDGLIFHRVIPNFVVQGGDPSGTGTGGSGQTLSAEFNDIPHIKGTMAMARTSDTDSADSQFYIALSRLKHLDGKYTVFAQVTEGLEVIDKIRKGDKIISFKIP